MALINLKIFSEELGMQTTAACHMEGEKRED